MNYEDRIYGKVEITEPVILEIINTPIFQRLKGIDQAGYRPLWVKPDIEIGEYDHTRFIHSIGVYLLLYKYNASLEEQVAGLIHDLSHSAFSHCIDYVIDIGSEKKHSHQDNVFDEYIKKSEIPEIIKKYNLDLDFILNDNNFPLKEKDIPDLCADRIDYSLRTAVIFGELNKEEKDHILENLTVENNNWVFKDFKNAKKYAQLFLKLNTIYYAGFSSAIMFCAVGDCLRHAFNKKYISETDLYKTDMEVIEKVKRYIKEDKRLSLLWERMNNRIGAKNNLESYDRKVFCKSRVVDPLCFDNKKIKRVSEIDSEWGNIVKRELKPKEYFVKFER